MPLKMILSYQNSDFFETDLKTRRLQLTISNQCPLCKLRNIYWNPFEVLVFLQKTKTSNPSDLDYFA